MDYEVMPLKDSDVDRVYKIGCAQKDFSADGQKNRFWPKATLFRWVRSEYDVAVKILVDEEFAGFALATIHPVTKKALLENFVVLEDFDFVDLEFLEEVHKVIEKKGAEFIAYFYDTVDDPLPEKLFKEAGYFKGNAHFWLHKNISFHNPVKE